MKCIIVTQSFRTEYGRFEIRFLLSPFRTNPNIAVVFRKFQTESKLQFSPFISRLIPKQNTKYIFVTLVFRSGNGNVFNFSFLTKLHFKTETYFFQKLKTLSDTDTLLDRFNAANFLGLRIVLSLFSTTHCTEKLPRDGCKQTILSAP